MDSIDLNIIHHLEKNCRLSHSEFDGILETSTTFVLDTKSF